jgi:sialic acid synthase SpsE
VSQKKLNNTYIIAETACSHDGSVKRLKKLIRAANNAKADAIQFQVWQGEDIVTPKHKDYKFLKSIELKKKEWKECFNYTKKNFPKLEIIACINDVETLKFCNKLGADAFKLHTSDLGNKDLLHEASILKKRIDLSVGGSTTKEINLALNYIRRRCEVWLMYGYQLFPTKPGSLKMLKMKSLAEKFKLKVGYQDHSPPDISGFTIPVLAIGSGIRIIEKHLTDTRKRKGTDSEAALEPEEFKLFVNKCDEAFLAMRKLNLFKLNEEEIKYRKYSKKKVFFSKDLKKGNILSNAELLIRRPVKKRGLFVDDINKIIGKKLRKNVKKYQLVERKFLI